MMSIFVTQHPENLVDGDENAILIYYFFSHQDEKRSTAVAVLRSLVYQLITARPRLIAHALPYFDIASRAEQAISSLEILWTILRKMLNEPELGTVFCVLDGLDECAEPGLRTLVMRFVELFTDKEPSAASINLRLVAVSRHLAGLQKCTRINLDHEHQENVVSDIQRFVVAQVENLPTTEGFNHMFRAHVRDTLLTRAEGTFLWAGFVMRELSKMSTSIEVYETLDELPPDLAAMYGRMLLQIPSRHRSMASKILRWGFQDFTLGRNSHTTTDLDGAGRGSRHSSLFAVD